MRGTLVIAAGFAAPAVLALLSVATMMDIHHRRVPLWLTLGGIGLGVLAAAAAGPSALQSSLSGLVVGGVFLLPFVVLGGIGGADALLLAAIGAWEGWRFVLWAAWWMALAGAGLAIVCWWRGKRTFPYVPAIALGSVLALVVS